MRPKTVTMVLLVFCLGLTRSGLPASGAEPRTIVFAGRTWNLKAGQGLGPGPNHWSAAEGNVRVDEQGHLHLAITPVGDSWECAEVVSPGSLGYGEYRWIIAGDLPTLDPRSVLGLFTYEDNDHEIDFELSRWGKPGDPNAQFVLQPYAPASMRRFDAGPADRLTVSLIWTATSVRFRCWVGEDTTPAPLHEWTYAGPKVPQPGKERTIMNFWLMDGRPSPGAKRQEAIIRSFAFHPSEPR